MKVIIAGSRTIKEKDVVYDCINKAQMQIGTITEVVCGMALGVDQIGKTWAKERNIPVKEMHYLRQYGRAGGPIRNGLMAEYADTAIIIWDGKSSGTKNMIEQMKKLEKPVVLIEI